MQREAKRPETLFEGVLTDDIAQLKITWGMIVLKNGAIRQIWAYGPKGWGVKFGEKMEWFDDKEVLKMHFNFCKHLAKGK